MVEQRKTKEGISPSVKYAAIYLSPEANLGWDIAYQAWYFLVIMLTNDMMIGMIKPKVALGEKV